MSKVADSLSSPRFHRIWSGMKYRCSNPKCDAYKNYGGRGIKVCDKWLEFINFKEDMYESYQNHVEQYGEKDTTLDRIDNNGNYCKENCRWATIKEQNNHLRPRIDREDIVGNRFGRLVVKFLCKTEKDLYYHCICDCGNEKDIKRASLLSGATQSCGCLQKERCSNNDADFIGKKFHKLTVVAFAFVKKYRKYYSCRCDCGNLTVARGSDLKNGHKKTCGHCVKER